MNWAGSNNIADGVTIDLGFLNSTQYNPDTQTAHLGPGAKWKDVYDKLEKHGRAVVGAREAVVGVGGFLIGGGNTFCTPTYGFACDKVVAYEVVLANGRIIIAEAEGENIGEIYLNLYHDSRLLIISGGGGGAESEALSLTSARPFPRSQGWR